MKSCYKVKQNDGSFLYGIYDNDTKNKVTNAKYSDYYGNFALFCGYVAFCDNNKNWGFVDENGEIIVPFFLTKKQVDDIYNLICQKCYAEKLSIIDSLDYFLQFDNTSTSLSSSLTYISQLFSEIKTLEKENLTLRRKKPFVVLKEKMIKKTEDNKEHISKFVLDGGWGFKDEDNNVIVDPYLTKEQISSIEALIDALKNYSQPRTIYCDNDVLINSGLLMYLQKKLKKYYEILNENNKLNGKTKNNSDFSKSENFGIDFNK